MTPDGDEIVECALPAVVTISNELGEPRYPTVARTMAARRMQPTVISAEELSLGAEQLQPKAALTRMFVPTVQGDCELITGDTPAEIAGRLVQRLREERLLP